MQANQPTASFCTAARLIGAAFLVSTAAYMLGSGLIASALATAANAGDWHLLRGDPFMVRLSSGLRRPKHQILGSDVAGRIMSVGSRVTQFQLGDSGRGLGG